MRVFLDECVDRRLSQYLLGHDVRTARQMRWTSIRNGALLALCEKEFDAFVTVDRSLRYQQHVAAYNIAVIVVRATSNRVEDLIPHVPALFEQLEVCAPGAVTIVGSLP